MPKSYEEYFSSLSPAQRDSRMSQMFAAHDSNMSYQDYNRVLNRQQSQYVQHTVSTSNNSSYAKSTSSSKGYKINQWTSIGLY